VWLYLTYTGEQPDPIDASHPPLSDAERRSGSVDHSQMRTRVYGKGHGEACCPTSRSAKRSADR
jgi:hypothetical protein